MAIKDQVTRAYSLKDEALVPWIKLIFGGFKEDRPRFVAFSPAYAAPFEEEWESKIDLADSQTTIEAQQGTLGRLTEDVEAKMALCRDSYKTQRHFVLRAYKEDPAMQRLFGIDNYEKASRDQNKMIELLRDSISAAEKNITVLTAKGYTTEMLDEMKAGRLELLDANDLQDSYKKKSLVETQERIKVLNDAYITTRDVCEAGKLIFAADWAKYERYLLPGENPPVEETNPDPPDTNP